MKRLINSLIGAAALTAMAITPAVADGHGGKRAFADVYAECGIGALLFNGGDSTSTTLAIISNVTWDLGTTAHSSNYSSDENCKGGSASTASLIMETYPSIERDLAQGQGEYLTAMIETRGCQGSEAALIQGLRQDMASAIAAPGYGEKSRKDKSEVLYNALNAHCVI